MAHHTLEAPHHLPTALTSLVGRRREVAEIVARLRSPDVRLLTLTGPGGTGKTRLAVAAATELLPDFRDGVFFVDLSPVRDPTLVGSSIASTLGVRQTGELSLQNSLMQALGAHRTLLVLDNFEQVRDAASLIASILGDCPDVKALVTSRIPLHVSGEYQVAVPPLGVPNGDPVTELETLSRYEAIALFVQRAASVKSDFALTQSNAASIAEVCARVDGLPLAIELAAARVKLLTPQALLARLTNRLGVLTAAPRDQPVRQQTLRSTLDWSYDLLTGPEAALFASLAVFVGGWDVTAAENVCGRPDVPQPVLDGLGALLDHSLIREFELALGEVRFGMLETVREYALERLEADPLAEQVRGHHARHFTALAEEAETELSKSAQGMWADRLEREHGNLRAALEWALRRGEAELAARLGAALARFWLARGHLSEGSRWLDQLVSAAHITPQLPPELRAQLLRGAGALAFAQGQSGRARHYWEEQLDVQRALGEDQGIARTLNNLGVGALGNCEFATARELLEESLALKRRIGERWDVAMTLGNLGYVLCLMGELDAAAQLIEQTLDEFRQLGDSGRTAAALTNLALVRLRQGDHVQARALRIEALEIVSPLDDRLGLAEAVEGAAYSLCARGSDRIAAQLLAAAAAARDALGAPLLGCDRPTYDQHVAQVRQRLGQAGFETAVMVGRKLSLHEAADLALVQLREDRAAAPPADPLTPREREVALLVARGLTNRQIAEQLVITAGTAELHVVHILNKLGFHTRSQIAAWAATRGLLP